MAIDLTVSIVIHNDAENIERCLRSLYEQTPSLSLEVFVVDNASEDGGPENVARAFPAVQLIRNKANLFFTRAHNMALRRAKGDFVLVLNPDIVIHDRALEKMVAYLREHADIGVLGPKLLHPDGTWQDSRAKRHHFAWALAEVTLINAAFPKNPFKRARTYPPPHSEVPQAVECVSGAAMLFPHAILERVGLFDEGFLIYSEEDDLCLRIREAGFPVIYFPDAVLTHIWGGTTRRKDPMFFKRIEWNSLLYYFKKHRSFAAYALLKAISSVSFPCLVAIRRLKRSIKRA